MIDRSQVPYLLRLLEDPSKETQIAVCQELSQFGLSLFDILETLPTPLDDACYRTLEPVFQQIRRRDVRARWSSWSEADGEDARIERALSLVAELQMGPRAKNRITPELDALAERFDLSHDRTSALALVHFLLHEEDFGGERDDYYNPANSNLLRVIATRRGLPVTLTCVFMLVGHRVGLKIDGCNFPGHFMARAYVAGQQVLIDCFNGGRLLDERRVLASAGYGGRGANSDEMNATSDVLIARVLRNLANAYDRKGSRSNRDMVLELLADTVQVGKADVA